MIELIHGDCLEKLNDIDSKSIDCVITSPPYWQLRDYKVNGQIGLESTVNEYITKLCDIFDQVKRVLKSAGTCFVNLGDTYGNDKCLCCVPDRFKIEMIDRGWICRNEIIWHKPNVMPSSVNDRLTVDYEKVFFFVKSKTYFFNMLYESSVCKESYTGRRLRNAPKIAFEDPKHYAMSGNISKDGKFKDVGKKYPQRHKRCVWTVNVKGLSEEHFAAYPDTLIEPMLEAGCPENGTVLDPFCGSGTTGIVAKRQGKNFVGIEINLKYLKIAERRINEPQQTKI